MCGGGDGGGVLGLHVLQGASAIVCVSTALSLRNVAMVMGFSSAFLRCVEGTGRSRSTESVSAQARAAATRQRRCLHCALCLSWVAHAALPRSWLYCAKFLEILKLPLRTNSRPAAGLLFRSRACVLQLQRAAPAAGRQAHAEALKSQAAEGGPIAPSSQTSRHISTRISCSELNHSRSCPFASCSLQILDPGAAARGKIKKHLKQQVRTPVAGSVIALVLIVADVL